MRHVIVYASTVYLNVFRRRCYARRHVRVGRSWNGAAEGNFKSNLHFLFAFYWKIRCHFFVSCFSFHFLRHVRIFVGKKFAVRFAVVAATCECITWRLLRWCHHHSLFSIQWDHNSCVTNNIVCLPSAVDVCMYRQATAKNRKDRIRKKRAKNFVRFAKEFCRKYFII